MSFELGAKMQMVQLPSNRTNKAKRSVISAFPARDDKKSNVRRSAHERKDSLTIYLEEIRRYPMLKPQEEYALAKRWRDQGDQDAAQKLITSHLGLVVRMAMRFKRYGLSIEDIISEGNIGLMVAVERFEPEKGFRLSTYAMWWIRSLMQEYIMRSWSLVRIGTTANQKKLFYNLRKIKAKIQVFDDGDLHPYAVKHIADRLDVAEDDVSLMNQRLVRDSSLNIQIRNDSKNGEWQDILVDDVVNQENILVKTDEFNRQREYVERAMTRLDDRERRIFTARRLLENRPTLRELSVEFGVSRERVRQIEVRAYNKVQKAAKSEYLAAEYHC
ncbi:RNA polymerase sigma factor RpoH [bacterium MnTg02]|nr:RNA polymerase sigma factor RpoH [bacterium MnTg02]